MGDAQALAAGIKAFVADCPSGIWEAIPATQQQELYDLCALADKVQQEATNAS